MALVVVYGAATMDFTFRVTSWPQPRSAVEANNVSSQPGGKGLNQAVACSRLDAETTLISSIGNDAYGQEIMKVLTDEYVVQCLEVQPLPIRRDIITDITAIMIHPESGDVGYVGYRNATDKLQPDYIDTKASGAIDEAHVVLITFDASVAVAQRMAEVAKDKHKYTILNFTPPVDIPLHILDAVDYVIATSREAREWLRMRGVCSQLELDAMDDEAVGEHLLNKGARTVIITQGNAGCLTLTLQGTKRYPGYPADNEIDVTGAQSAFCAGLAVALARMVERGDVADILESRLITFASAARTLCIQLAGAYESMPNLQSVEALISRKGPLSPLD